MNLRKLEYIVTIAEEQNISRAADILFISRPALNHYLIDLEAEIGTPLFKRIHKKLVPTYTGGIYIDAAKQMLGIKKQTYKTIEDIADSSAGCIAMGIGPSLGTEMLKKILPVFLKRYPNYKLDMIEGNVRELEQAVESGRIDFAIGGKCSISSALEHIIFAQSEVALILPPRHPLGRLAAPRNKAPAAMDLRLLENESFILMNRDTNVRAISDAHFTMAGFFPKILVECSMNTMAYDLVKKGLGPAITLRPYRRSETGSVHFFSLSPREIWNYSAAFRKGTVFTKSEKYFIELVRNFHQGLFPPRPQTPAAAE